MSRLAFLLWCWMWSFAALGQTPREPAAIYAEGKAHFKRQEYEEALRFFEESYVLSKEPQVLIDMWQCQRHLKRYEDAARSLREYLTQAPTGEMRSQVEALLKDTESKIPPPESLPSSVPASLPSSTPASVPVVEALVLELNLPGQDAPVTPLKRWGAVGLYGASFSLMVGGVVASGVSLNKEFALQEARLTGQGEALEGLAQQERRWSRASQFMFGLSFVGGASANRLSSNIYVPKVLYGSASGFGVFGATMLGLALKNARGLRELQAQDDPNVNELLFFSERAEVFGRTAGIYAAGAVLTGGVGYLLSRRW